MHPCNCVPTQPTYSCLLLANNVIVFLALRPHFLLRYLILFTYVYMYIEEYFTLYSKSQGSTLLLESARYFKFLTGFLWVGKGHIYWYYMVVCLSLRCRGYLSIHQTPYYRVVCLSSRCRGYLSVHQIPYYRVVCLSLRCRGYLCVHQMPYLSLWSGRCRLTIFKYVSGICTSNVRAYEYFRLNNTVNERESESVRLSDTRNESERASPSDSAIL